VDLPHVSVHTISSTVVVFAFGALIALLFVARHYDMSWFCLLLFQLKSASLQTDGINVPIRQENISDVKQKHLGIVDES
jgi:alpha/beta superfamily hydrolase